MPLQFTFRARGEQCLLYSYFVMKRLLGSGEFRQKVIPKVLLHVRVDYFKEVEVFHQFFDFL